MKETLEEIVNNMSNKAVEYAKSFDKVFNYSEDDIKDLEEILDYYSNDLKGSFLKNVYRKINKTMPTENQIYTMFLIWGSYLGQVLKMHSNSQLS